MKKSNMTPIAVVCLLLTPIATQGQTVHDPDLMIETVVSGLSNPTMMTFIGPDRFLINDQSRGQVRLVIDGVQQPQPVLDLPVATGLEPGLHGIVKDPGFFLNGYIYLYYTQSTFDGGPRLANRISRFTWDGTRLDPDSELVLHELPALHSSHHGGVLAMGLDGTLFAVIGDQHANERTTNFVSGGPREVGVVVRFNRDGTLPEDNPFDTPGWEYIYAFGQRNVYGIAIDPLTGELWQSENGEPGLEEVNLLKAGTNSGWERVFGIVPTPVTGLFQVPGSFYSNPEFDFRVTAAPTSVTFQTTPILGRDSWNDMYVAEGHFSSNHRIFRFALNENRDGLTFDQPALQDLTGNSYAELQPIVFAENFGIVTDVTVGPDGFLYVVDRGVNRVYRIRPTVPTGDGDVDGDIDLADLAVFQRCFGDNASDECLGKFDFDNNGNVDENDYEEYLNRLSGPLNLY